MSQPPLVPTAPQLNLLRWILQPLDVLERNHAHYGDCFTIRMGGYLPLTFFSNPEAIEQIFTAPVDQFDSGRANLVLRRTLGDNSLLILDGERHKRQRQLLMPPFHGERMRAYGQLITEVTESVIQDLVVGQVLKVRSVAQQISLKVILQAVFGLTEGQRYRDLEQLLATLLEFTSSRLSFATNFIPILQRDLGAWSPGGRFVRMMQQINQLLYSEIEERRQQFDPTRSDILTLLLSARDEAGEPMRDEELRDELMTLLVAGHETTATAISWALYWIHKTPDVQKTLLAELDQLGDADPSAIGKLPYLSAVCSETLRLYPVAFIALIRLAQSAVKIGDYSFEPGAALIPCIYLVHHREDLYPNPKQFRPERFLERQFSPYEYLPFGGSDRRCIGAAFALFEMKLVLATILRRYQLDLAELRPVKPVRRGVTIAPQGGIKMIVKAKCPVSNLLRTATI